MATDPTLLPALKLKLRRKFATDLNGLRRLSDEVFQQAQEQVTIHTHGFSDGSASGEITCPRSVLLLAIEEILAELDPDAPRPAIAAVAYLR